MNLLDYVVNLSLFSLFASTPLVLRSFIAFRPIKHYRIFGGIYAGIITAVLVALSFEREGYVYDLRYAAVILSFAYLGPVGGLITAAFSIAARLLAGGHWLTPIIGWLVVIVGFLIVYLLTPKLNAVKKTVALFLIYLVVYVIDVPIIFKVFPDKPLFHLQYILFIMLGVVLGVLLIESYLKLYRLNDRLLETYKMVEESEFNYRLIAENTSDLIKVMDKQHSISYFSPSHQLVLGYDLSELEGADLCEFIHPDDIGMFRNTIQGMFESKESQSMEFRFLHKGGRWIEFESRCVPVEGENHAVEHIVIISRDISERKKSEEILLQSEKLSIVGELAAGIAHEIRNPLTTIKGFIQLYKSTNNDFEFSELLLGELGRIETITSEMLTLGKPQAVKMVGADLRELIENTMELLSPQALLNGIQFQMVSEKSPFFITCEKNQLRQVFLNIFKNAMEAMPEGGEIHIQLRNGAPGECVVSVKDHGCGIPEELLPRLGEPFYSLKEKGTGLGIMICHKIIKQHHGSITYHSKENEGTLVEIKLPLVE
ncbi:PAS domain-containing sensor histidine kinase [Neobacillus niacini]|uniref:PAS domain-containing sensor histidine kinase n=1 Tax=Neobacillus niacini TaxID=86668 RepID=UPI0021CB8FE0|nr:PAS domain-containing sensor histidine kinase [Neobacillus niacini]MCM3766762.1 ATP-binding protein [Neobacillus niacini]